ncbi:hypothetical protein V8E51_003084 [Hyaloscypha variabilis]
MFLLELKHDGVKSHKDEIVSTILGEGAVPEDEDYNILRSVVMTKVKHFKAKMIRLTKQHVQDAIDHDRIHSTGSLADENDPEKLVRFFNRRATDDNIFEIFWFMQHYIDMSKTEKLGRYYLERVYENLCMRTKLHLDWLNGGEMGRKNSRDELNNFISELADQDVFKDVTKDEFVEVWKKTSRTKPSGQKKQKVIKDGDRLFFGSAPPARKSTSSSGDEDRAGATS